MDLIKSVAYMTLWAVGFIAVDAVTHPFMGTIQNFVAGSRTGDN